MTTTRKFAGFNKKGQSTTLGTVIDIPFRMKEVPDGGMCLSAFVILSERGNPERVLLGRLNTSAPWDHIGALDEDRVQAHSKGWMIPSSHLIIYESPQDAASRILKEQLALKDVKLGEPRLVSEVYTPKRFPNLPQHWDFEFLFRGDVEERAVDNKKIPDNPWRELAFVDLGKTSKKEIARSHEDILESAGFKFLDSSP